MRSVSLQKAMWATIAQRVNIYYRSKEQDEFHDEFKQGVDIITTCASHPSIYIVYN